MTPEQIEHLRELRARANILAEGGQYLDGRKQATILRELIDELLAERDPASEVNEKAATGDKARDGEANA
jgi:hypothetical protein